MFTTPPRLRKEPPLARSNDPRAGRHSREHAVGVPRHGIGELTLDAFLGFGTTGVAAKELTHTFVGADLKEEFAELAAWCVADTGRGSLLREISEQFWRDA